MDWAKNGGACKHLRALKRVVDYQLHAGILPAEQFVFPSTSEEAEVVEENNARWYGDRYQDSVTTSPITQSTAFDDTTASTSPPVLPPLTRMYEGNLCNLEAEASRVAEIATQDPLLGEECDGESEGTMTPPSCDNSMVSPRCER